MIVVRVIHKSPAPNMYSKGDSKSPPSSHGNNKNTIMLTSNMFNIFPNITDTKENSIFIYACMRDNIEEFIKLTIVKIDMIAIPQRTRYESYPGMKRAIKRERKNIPIPRSTRSDNIFPTIFLVSDLFSVISRIAIVYRPKSARNANIHKYIYTLL